MAIQTAPVQLSVVLDAQTQKEIGNTIDAPGKLADAIEEFKKNRTAAEVELAQSLSKDLAAPFNVESATAEELQPIIEKRIEELKRSQPDALKAVLRPKLGQLANEAAAEKDEAEALCIS